MVELVDTQDLKSCEQQCSCGFKSRPGHLKTRSRNTSGFFILDIMEQKPYIVYVLQSQVDRSLYKGMTTNMENRLKQHNAGKTKSTKGKKPWIVVYTEYCNNAQDARDREKYFKTAAGRRFLKQLL